MTEATTANEPLSHDRAPALFQRIYDLLNEHDPAHIPAIFTEDVVFEDDAWPETVRGHADMRRFLGAVWRAFPDLRFELVEGPFLADAGGGAAARVRITGTMRGPLDPPGFAPTGGTMSTEYGGFYEFDGDRIRRGRIIINMNDAAAQLGAAPMPGSRGESLVVRMQRLQARRLRGRAA